jgi:uncharacterized protein (DUF885 family)
MGQVFENANEYVEAFAALDPFAATMEGIPGHDDESTDYSPDGRAARAELNRRTRARLDAAVPESDDERLAREIMLERLQSALDLEAAGEDLRPISNLAAPSVTARQVFDLMSMEGEAGWQAVLKRLRALPDVLEGYRRTLEEGIARGKTSARRQAIESARQAEVWSGDGRREDSFFRRMVSEYARSHGGTLSGDLEAAADEAAGAYARLADYLRQSYAPRAVEADGVGEERYRLWAREYNGVDIDPRETYEWGWQELHWVESEMARTSDQIKPGAGQIEAIELLNSDPARAIEGEEAYRAWLQEVHDQAVRGLHGTHFDIPAQIRRIDVMIPPPGGALAPYYTAPSEDFATPGHTWWPTGDAISFPTWDRVSIAYHEGVPGHHLQVGGARCLGDRLSRYQKTLLFISGHGEGWALYAERLMGELGYLEKPDYYLGLLAAQALRSYRVVVDIGMHLGLSIPNGESFRPGAVWDHDLAVEFGLISAGQTPDFIRSEVVRYLGLPAQAISYKVGEREWLRARESARSRFGPAFDLKRFHTVALDLGPLPLSMLQPEVEKALAGAGAQGST